MSKIIKFPNHLIVAGKGKDLHDRQFDRELQEANIWNSAGSVWNFWKVMKVLLMVARMPAFLVLYFLRIPMMMVCSVLYLPLFLLALFAWYAFPEKPQMWEASAASAWCRLC